LSGTVWFAVASLLCAVAPNSTFLILAGPCRESGAALLTPGSLAILEAVFRPDDRGKAIGAWSGYAGVGTAIGPLAWEERLGSRGRLRVGPRLVGSITHANDQRRSIPLKILARILDTDATSSACKKTRVPPTGPSLPSGTTSSI